MPHTRLNEISTHATSVTRRIQVSHDVSIAKVTMAESTNTMPTVTARSRRPLQHGKGFAYVRGLGKGKRMNYPAEGTPAWADRLLQLVDDAFQTTGAQTPGWPEPQHDVEPADHSYSRVTDAGKYRILESRLAAWATVLEQQGIARTAATQVPQWRDELDAGNRYDGAVRMQPKAVGALPIVLATTLVDNEPFGVEIGIVEEATEDSVMLCRLPTCGCDACDDGSAALLEELDDTLLSVLAGGVTHAQRDHDSATQGWNGYRLSGKGSVKWLDPRRSPRQVRRWIGSAWLNS